MITIKMNQRWDYGLWDYIQKQVERDITYRVTSDAAMKFHTTGNVVILVSLSIRDSINTKQYEKPT
jgi:hypothetical protein